MSVARVVILGAAGQAREVAWYIDEINRVRPTFDVLGFVVSDVARLGAHDSKERVLGGYEWLEAHQADVDAAVLGVGTPAFRAKVATEISAAFPRLDWPAVLHPSARIDHSTAKIGRGVMLGAGVVATVNVAIADFAMVNFGATIGHETRIGRACVVNPGANLSGGVTLGDGVLVGAGAVILQYRSIGAGATVGAGAVVTKDVLAGSTVVGIPARPLSRP
jgi:sugar O-acyltransferase (sialic acid O-acetyltransferase NeuD family)